MTSNLAVVYTIRIRAPSPKWIGITTVGSWMLQQHRPQKVQNSPKFHHVGSASLFSSSLSSRRCICLFHIAVSEYMPKITYFSSRRCICLFHIVVSEYMPKIIYFSRNMPLLSPARLQSQLGSRSSLSEKPPQSPQPSHSTSCVVIARLTKFKLLKAWTQTS